MARKIASRLLINGTLTALTPLHVGGYGTSPDTDLPLAQNGRGEWYVPGTSLTGVIRAWCKRAFARDLIAYLFGPEMERSEEERGHASFVLVEDAVVRLNGRPIEIRDGVGIDRRWGAAADGSKFDRAILPRGAQLDLQMTVEIAETNNRAVQTKALIGHLVEALRHEELRFGAARTRGLGRVQFELRDVREQTLNTPEGILKTLIALQQQRDGKTNAAASLTIEDLKKAAGEGFKPREHPRLEVEIKWRPKGPLMVKAGYEGVGVDMLPLVSGVNEGVALVLPGSSIKGALRSHAERIVRTVTPPKDQNKKMSAKFADQIEVELINELFGARNKPENGQDQTKSGNEPRLGLSALSVDDCYARKPMNRDAWQFVERATAKPDEDSQTWELRKAIDPELESPILSNEGETSDAAAQDKARQMFAAVKEHRFEMAHHVAIDRWTGGASEGALFSVLAPHGVEWDVVRLTIDLTRIPGEKHSASVALLLLVLRDLMRNRIPFGFATNRGMGEIEVEEIRVHTFHLGGFPETVSLTTPKKDEERKILSELGENLLENLTREWQKALGITTTDSSSADQPNGGQA